MAFWHRLKKKLLKRYVLHAFFPSTRTTALRWCGWEIGDDVYIADGLVIVEELAERDNLRIGNRVSIAPRVTLVTSSHPNRSRIRPVAPVASGPIVIEDDVWIGAGAVVLPGVRIGRGAVVGSLALVAHDVAELTVVAGQPARPIRTLETPPNWT
jgi:acetyltransferase-like isoleucine patch superfamily enzyme